MNPPLLQNHLNCLNGYQRIPINMNFCRHFNIKLKHLTSMVTDNKENPDCCISWIKDICVPLGVVTSPGWYLPMLGQCLWPLSGVCWCGSSRWSLTYSWRTCLFFPGCFYEFCRNFLSLIHPSWQPGCWVWSYCCVRIVFRPGKPGEMQRRGEISGWL